MLLSFFGKGKLLPDLSMIIKPAFRCNLTTTIKMNLPNAVMEARADDLANTLAGALNHKGHN